ncbi:MAG TPA: chromate resistance protein ChrB domain-containing protein [Clostridia bacterium]|nr:chromate resistance protein ChrB domain-containing protein [Clostridia bacterium]
MKWVTRAHVHVDRVACPWLISRFVDSEAEFAYVATDIVDQFAQNEVATPFDLEGVELGHQDGHCSFVSIMEKYHLTDKALVQLADVVNAADTDQLDANPYARGLEALAQGFSLMYPDDTVSVEAQFAVYDALYAFFRLKVAGEGR